LDIFSVSENSRIDFCGNSRFILSALLFESVKKATLMIARCKESIKQRYLFEITKENLQYCKDLVKIGCDLHHSNEIEANLVLNEKESLGSIILNEVQQQPIYSNVKEIIQQQQNQVNNTMVQLIFKNTKMENGSSSIFVEGDKYRLSQVIIINDFQLLLLSHLFLLQVYDLVAELISVMHLK
jgi:hypothetical protein